MFFLEPRLIRWQDHVRNDEVAARTGLRPVMESIRRRREAIFGNMARMSPNIPAHQALRLQVEASVGRRSDRDWVRSSGRPRNCWIDQLRQDHYITLHKIVFRVPKITKDR